MRGVIAETALQTFLRRWGGHSGACCTFDEAGKVIVTEASCRCDQLTKDARAEYAALASPESRSLDVAWAEAEAALPEGWLFSITPYYPSGWEVEAHDITRVYEPGRNKHGTGTTGNFDTPAAALLALAVRLREHPEGESR